MTITRSLLELRLVSPLLVLVVSAWGDTPVTQSVRSQYDTFPYPGVGTPTNLNNCWTNEYLKTTPAWLRTMDSYIFDGEWLLQRRHPKAKPIRVLVAGGGAGRESILLAKEMRELGITGSVTSFDLSSVSVAQAKSWAQNCGFDSMMNSVVASFGEFSEAHARNGTEPYDVIFCSGVLHHLENPARGLEQLRSMLAPTGVIQLLVYGKHGRAGTVEAQEGLRYALPPKEDLTDAERNAELRDFVTGKHGATLPNTSIIQRNPALRIRPDLADPELFDRLLHAQEHRFSVMDLHDLAGNEGLEIAAMLPEAVYQPDATVFTTQQSRQTYMAKRVRQRTVREQMHFSELMTSFPIHHTALLVRKNAIPTAGIAKVQMRRTGRRGDNEWRRGHAVKVNGRSHLQFHPETVQQIKQAVGRGQPLPIQFEFKDDHKGSAHLPIPRLAFRFTEILNQHTRMPVDQMINTVAHEVQSWGAHPPSFEQVAQEFFDWLDAVEAMGDGICEREQSEVSPPSKDTSKDL